MTYKYTDVQLLTISRQKVETFNISHAFLSLTVAKLSTLKNSPHVQLTLYKLTVSASEAVG